jgi:hypothetical protein
MLLIKGSACGQPVRQPRLHPTSVIGRQHPALPDLHMHPVSAFESCDTWLMPEADTLLAMTLDLSKILFCNCT